MFPEGFRHHAHKINVGFEGSSQELVRGVDVRNNNKHLEMQLYKKEKKEVYIDTCGCYSSSATPTVIGDNFQPALN